MIAYGGLRWEIIRGDVFEKYGVDLDAVVDERMALLAHKAAQIGFTYGALGRDFEYAYKNVNDMLADEKARHEEEPR